MNHTCFVNGQIETNLAGNHSESFLETERQIIREEIRRNLCNGLAAYKHIDGNYYCIFHLPDKDKDQQEFREASINVITKIQKQIDNLKDLPDDKKESAKAKIKYDFRYVRFPCAFGFRGRKVEVEMNFSHATFFDVADFMKTEFLSYANFDSVTFHKIAYFIFAKFKANAYFFSAKFLGETNFKYTFFSNGKFTNAIFSEKADFEFSEFVRHANFINVSFLKEVNFQYAKLFIANFENAKFLSFTNFESVEILKSANFKGNKENLVFGENAILNFQDAKIEEPKEVSFHTIRLSPNWFVNIDSRLFSLANVYFTDSNGKLIDANYIKQNVKSELNCLNSTREIGNPKQLYKIACRQLAENAENNNRFEEASNFRRMAFETEWLEKKERISIWIKNLVPESEKLKRRVAGSIAEEDKPIPPINSFGILRRSSDFFIHSLYRFTSFYGESWSWAIGVLLMLILIIFPFIYTQTNFYVCSVEKTNPQNNSDCITRTLNFGEGMRQSLATATLQNVETRKPNSPASETFTILEKIFAPLQAALLALAIRRKFMR
jgi:uncharacterized protein YjbI with pentapeptide repeats